MINSLAQLDISSTNNDYLFHQRLTVSVLVCWRDSPVLSCCKSC